MSKQIPPKGINSFTELKAHYAKDNDLWDLVEHMIAVEGAYGPPLDDDAKFRIAVGVIKRTLT